LYLRPHGSNVRRDVRPAHSGRWRARGCFWTGIPSHDTSSRQISKSVLLDQRRVRCF
jgi:hypothetical protein